MSQEEVKPLKEDQFFVVVDQFLDHPETGELIVKQPVFRTKFCALNRPAFTDRTQQEALLAKHAARPKTTNEHVGHLQIENSAKEEELVALRARLASLEKGGKPPPQTTPKDK